MEDNINHILEPEDYFKAYRDNIEELKNNPELIEFDKLTYEVFEMNPQGKRFLELAKERYLTYALVPKGTPTYQLDVLWQEGFKDAFRGILLTIHAHKQRIKAGTK
jgi:hypothetical protein